MPTFRVVLLCSFASLAAANWNSTTLTNASFLESQTTLSDGNQSSSGASALLGNSSLTTKSGPTRSSIASDVWTLVPSDAVAITSTYQAQSEIDRLFQTDPAEDRSTLLSLWQCASALAAWNKNNFTELEDNQTTSIAVFGIGGGAFWEKLPTNGITWQACDGVARVSYTEPVQWSTLETTGTASMWNVTWSNKAPPCTPSSLPFSAYCPQLSTLSNDFGRKSFSILRQGTLVDWVSTPAFWWWDSVGCTSATTSCRLMVESAHALYWPVPARSADFCNSNVYAYATETSAMLINGTTYTSPSVYITYNNIRYISAFSSGDVSSSTTFKLESLVVSVDPRDVSTVCGPKNNQATYPFDFQDLQDPIPWSAWMCQPGCVDNPQSCLPIDPVTSSFQPRLAWPNTFLSILNGLNTLNPDACTFGYGEAGIYDPPQLLTVADALTKPATQETHQLTRPLPITAEPPAPSKPGPALAVPTMSAGPDPRPTSGILPGLPSKDDPFVDDGNAPSIPVVSKNEHPSHTPGGDGQPPSQPPATSPVNSPDDPQQGPPPERAPDPRPVHDSISPSGTGNAAAAPIAESSRGIGGFIASMIAQPPFQGNVGSTKPEQNGINEVAHSVTQRPESSNSPISPHPLQAFVPIGSSTATIYHENNDAKVLSGTTFWAGDTAFIGSRTIVFKTDGVALLGGDPISPTSTRLPFQSVGSTASSASMVAVLTLDGQNVTFSQNADGTVRFGHSVLREGDIMTVALGEIAVLKDGVVLRQPGVTTTAKFAAVAGIDSVSRVVVVGGTSITMGSAAVAVGGKRVSYGTSGLVLGSKTVALPTGSTVLTMRNGQVLSIAFPTNAAGEHIAESIDNLLGSKTGAVPAGCVRGTMSDGGTAVQKTDEAAVERRPESTRQSSVPVISGVVSARPTGEAIRHSVPVIFAGFAVLSGALAFLL